MKCCNHKGFKVFFTIQVSKTRINPETVIHRLTGDGKKSELIEPLWTLNKLKVLSDIDNELKIRESYQGKKLPLFPL